MMIAGGADPTNASGRRIAAFFLDDILALLVATSVVKLMGMDWQIQTVTKRGVVYEYNLKALPILLGVQFFYIVGTHIFLVASKGFTPGKLAFGVRIVGWDGHPPGLGKATIRAFAQGFLNLFGCLYWVTAFAIMQLTKGHKAPHDLLADTFVIDASYFGRAIVSSGGKLVAGGRTASKEVVERVNAEQAAISGVVVPPGKKATEPFYDKDRDTYVVYSAKQSSWMQLDKMSGQWTLLP